MDNLQSALPKLTQELSEIRRENDRLRYEVSIAVEEEVRRVISDKRVGIELSLVENTINQPLRQNTHTKSYDMPCQITNQSDNRLHLDDLSQKQTSNPDLDAKKKELLTWEQTLLAKSSQMEEAALQFNQKMSKMATQKAEIQANVKKLQTLTQDYQKMLETEERNKVV